MIGQKQILQQEDSSITAEMNHRLELCNGSHLSIIIKGMINYHDHPKLGFCFKENLSHFLCMKGITGLVWREGSDDKTRKDRYNNYTVQEYYHEIHGHLLLMLCF